MGAKMGLKPTLMVIEAGVGIGSTETGGFGLRADVVAKVGGLSQADAEKIVEAGYKFCPYSIAVVGNVTVTVEAIAV